MIFLRKVLCLILAFACFWCGADVSAVSVSAKSAVLIDFYSGDILFEKNASQRLSMASTTKIMTAICAIENADLSEVVTVDKRAVGVEGSSMYLGYGEKITVENLVYGLMLSSGNDAAVALALHVSGSIENFARLMNDTAKKIGAVNTSFKNPNGLDEEGHYTTAYDLAMITRYAMQNEKFCEIVSTKQKKMPWQGRTYGRTLRNHNKLLFLTDYCDGVKTGFTKRSGRCLVSSANKDNLRVIAVTLYAPDDWNDHKNMMSYAIDNYKAVNIVKKGEYAFTAPVSGSDKEYVKCVFADDIFVTAKKDDNVDISFEYGENTHLDAPVKIGADIGKININAGNRRISAKVVSCENADKKKNIKEKISGGAFSENAGKIFEIWLGRAF